jgi:hypothetical protein
MLQDNTYGLMMTAAPPGLPTFLNFLKSVSVNRRPCAAPIAGDRIEPKLLLKNPQETCSKRFSDAVTQRTQRGCY